MDEKAGDNPRPGSKGEQHNSDAFVLERVFPDAADAFVACPLPLASVRDNAIVVLDTNSLLVPYGVAQESLKEIGTTYEKLAGKKQLIVPARVAREFARNRSTKLAELHAGLSRRRNGLQPLEDSSYPLLEGLSEFAAVRRLSKEIAELQAKYRDAVGGVLSQLLAWQHDDPVTQLYRSCIDKGSIVEASMPQAKIEAEFAYRRANDIPPGYKDQAKSDGGIGDFIIWRTILELGERRKAHVIFVSNEGKADWWTRSEKQQLHPRFELVDEFRRASGGRSFHMLKFSEFLATYGASKSVVEEVRKEEQVQRALEAPTWEYNDRARTAFMVEEQVQEWLQGQGYLIHDAALGVQSDFAIETQQHKIFAVDVKFIPGPVVRERVTNAVIQSSVVPMPSVLFLIARSEQVLEKVHSVLAQVHTQVRIATGVLGADGCVQIVRPPLFE